MKFVYLVLLAVILIGSISLASCRLAYRAGQESASQSGAPDTQQQPSNPQSGPSAPSNPGSGSSSTQGGATANQPPQARIISITPATAYQGDTVSFKGEGTDADGTVKAYLWKSSIDGVISRVESFDFNMLSAGTHVITFLVADNNGAKSQVVTSGVVINTPDASPSGGSSGGAAPNKPPEAHINSIFPAEATEGKIVSFDGVGRDTDGTVKSYLWKSSIDGVLSTKDKFSTDKLSEGSHIIFFQVMDNRGTKSDEVNAKLVIHKLAQVSQASGPAKITNAAIRWSNNDTIYSWRVENLKHELEYWVYGDVAYTGFPSQLPPEDIAKVLAALYEHDKISQADLYEFFHASAGQGTAAYHGEKHQNPTGTFILFAYDPVSKAVTVVDISSPIDTSGW